VLAFVWFGLPWGLTWAELVPTPRRLLVSLALWPLFLPGCLVLAAGLRRLAGSSDGRVARWAPGVAWFGVLLALTVGHILLTADWRPLFIVPVALVGVSFLPAFPLWLLPDRPGITLARGLSHAGAASWLLGCHLPFVHAA
jgi:hypothetical protein